MNKINRSMELARLLAEAYEYVIKVSARNQQLTESLRLADARADKAEAENRELREVVAAGDREIDRLTDKYDQLKEIALGLKQYLEGSGADDFCPLCEGTWQPTHQRSVEDPRYLMLHSRTCPLVVVFPELDATWATQQPKEAVHAEA
jgi:DNA repair exonuclease SbcCD ATPase subunit